MATTFAKSLPTETRHYQFEIRQTPRTKEPYLTVTETSILGGRRQRVALTIHHQDAASFLNALQTTISHLPTHQLKGKPLLKGRTITKRNLTNTYAQRIS